MVTRWLDAAPPEWDPLRRSDANATAAHGPELWAALASSTPGLQVRLLAVFDEHGLAGGMPVAIERRHGLDWISAMPWVLPGAPLARDGAHAAVDAAAAAAFASLQRERRAAGGLWSLYRPEGPAFAVPQAACPAGRLGEVETAWIAVDRGTEAAWRAIDRKSRQALARAREDLAFAEEPAALAEAWTLYARQARAWNGYRPLAIEMLRRLLASRDPRGEPCARLFTVRDARGLLSSVMVLDSRCEAFLWWSGTRSEGRAHQAFGVLAWSVVEWAARNGRKRVNLGASPGLAAVASFKDSLGATPFRYPVLWLDGSHAPWTARVLARLRRRAPAGAAG